MSRELYGCQYGQERKWQKSKKCKHLMKGAPWNRCDRNDSILDILMICFWALNSTHREMPQMSSLCHLAAALPSNQVMLQQAGHAEEGGTKQKAWISRIVKTLRDQSFISASFIAKHLMIWDNGNISIISRHLLKSFTYQLWHDFRSLWEKVFLDYLCSHSVESCFSCFRTRSLIVGERK